MYKAFPPSETPASSSSRILSWIPVLSCFIPQFPQSNPQAAAVPWPNPALLQGAETRCWAHSASGWGLKSPLGLFLSLGQLSDYDPSVHEANTSSPCSLEKLHFSAAPLPAVDALMEGSSRHVGKRKPHPTGAHILWVLRLDRIWVEAVIPSLKLHQTGHSQHCRCTLACQRCTERLQK